MASNPGWVLGYVPTPDEWNSEFGGKVDYPAPLAQGGTGAESAAGANYNIQQRGLISTTASPYAAQPLTFYGLQTGTGVITVNLPQLAPLTLGDWIELADIDYDAATNNVTIAAYSGDEIALFNSVAASQTINVSGTRVVLIANVANWRMLV